ncbi:hypothetical protein [Streptomyces bluensis]|uniref:hypothetical protein n=1 Tax=Streptomyces bluensis TaxID=33897 RepID=UPI00331D1636
MADSHAHHLQGRVSVIAGASCGIGAATARDLAARGAHVVLAARITDVTRLDDVDGLMDFAASEYGPVDHLIVSTT